MCRVQGLVCRGQSRCLRVSVSRVRFYGLWFRFKGVGLRVEVDKYVCRVDGAE